MKSRRSIVRYCEWTEETLPNVQSSNNTMMFSKCDDRQILTKTHFTNSVQCNQRSLICRQMWLFDASFLNESQKMYRFWRYKTLGISATCIWLNVCGSLTFWPWSTLYGFIGGIGHDAVSWNNMISAVNSYTESVLNSYSAILLFLWCKWVLIV